MTINDHLMTINDQLKQSGKATSTFYFKRFKVQDGMSTMKVGTDSVLLGASVEAGEVADILEVGTGCGVIALILAQQSLARIDAIEVDENSVLQARENVTNSPWSDRISVIHGSFQEYIIETRRKYDLIVSNPPFFTNSLKSPFQKRNISRHNDSLSFRELVTCADQVIAKDGSLWIILPGKESNEFISTARNHGFFIKKIIKILPKPGQNPQRKIMQFTKYATVNPVIEELAIRNVDGSYSTDYVELTKEFYLDF